MNCRKTLIAGAAAAAVATLLTGAAQAQTTPNCDDATMFPNPIYVTGSSAFEATAQSMGAKLAGLTGAGQATIIYKATSSCDGITAIRDSAAITGTADYFAVDPADATKTVKKNCLLDHSVTKADVGISDIFYENCPGNALPVPAAVVDTLGPVQAMIFIVPHSNTAQTNLTAEEGQDIWGCGMKGLVTPFISETDIQQRNSGSGTQGVVAKAINVPPGSFKGKMNAAGGDMVASVVGATNPGSAIGFLAADSFDTKRPQLTALAFRAFGQTKAYYADSTADTFDKKNVRDGHYVVWGPEHFFAAADSTTHALTNAKAATFIGWVNGTMTTAAFNYIDVEAAAGVIPQCAMKVTRSTDGGSLSPAAAPTCSCRFEQVATKLAAGAVPPGCTSCTGDGDCVGANAGKHCLNKFCE
jgi:hypothetical protein